MNKEYFLKMLNEAKEDEYGNLYVLGHYDNRIYFCTITTICEDILTMANRDGHEVYDRHFWGDDTLECKIVTTNKTDNTTEGSEYKIPKRIEKMRLFGTGSEITIKDKINEIIDVLNKYESKVEVSDE